MKEKIQLKTLAQEKNQVEQEPVDKVSRRVLVFEPFEPEQQANKHNQQPKIASHFNRATYDQVIVEAPLQIVLTWYCVSSENSLTKPFLVTMRTPGNDINLVQGLLLAADIISTLSDIESLVVNEPHQIEAHLSKGIVPDWDKLARQNMSMASCGLCGVKQIKQLALSKSVVSDAKIHWLTAKSIAQMPQQLRTQQEYFTQTGGVHGAGLWCVKDSELIATAEDVGRHNAVDKVIGAKLKIEKNNPLKLEQLVLVLSGRISFELVQKAVMANIPAIVAIGAPSSLAIKLAKQFNITLIGFTQLQQCNVYCGEQRLQ